MSGAPRDLDELLLLIALRAPEKQGNAWNAYIPWFLINEARKALEQRGIDWRALKRSVDAEREKRK